MPRDVSSMFVSWESVPADTQLIFQAMAQLGLACEFADLSLTEMQTVLALARSLKRCQNASESGSDAN